MAKPAKASLHQKTKECSLYGFLVQEKAKNNALNADDANLMTPYAKLVQFCTFLVSNGHPKGH